MKLLGRPVPTPRWATWMLWGLVPAALVLGLPGLTRWVLGYDLALLVLLGVDYLLAPTQLEVRRQVEPLLSAGRPNRVELHVRGHARGELSDAVQPGPHVAPHRQPLTVNGSQTLTYALTPTERGELVVGPVSVRLVGPLGLCARQLTVGDRQTVKVFPDLQAIARDAMKSASRSRSVARRRRHLGEGREFESLREYRPGDDRRAIDWKATARRARPIVRVHQPERHQPVVVLIDCGRHMAGVVDGRPKIEHAVDAALQLCQVGLSEGDLIGAMAFGARVQSFCPPASGAAQLQALAQQLYAVRATLEESDYGGALDRVFEKSSRRTLVVLLTDLFDAQSSTALVQRITPLVPRHLPMVVSLTDEALHALSLETPSTLDRAYQRQIAAQLEDDHRVTGARLSHAGAVVVRERARHLGPAAIDAYLRIKARGAL